MRFLLLPLVLLLLAAPAAAAVPERCPGAPLRADRALTGELASELQGGFVLAGFDVPEGTTELRVRYCFDQPEVATPAAGNTLDLGLYEPPATPGKLWGAEEFRGWSGGEVREVRLSARGFGGAAAYAKDKRATEPGTTTRAYLPGRIPAGRWAAELGLAALLPPSLGNTDGKVAYRVEVELSRDPALAREPYAPEPVATAPVKREAGWYRGDFHVHSEHSLAAAYEETFDDAFGPRAQGRPDLDFVSLTEHNTTAQARDVGRFRARYPGKLVLRANEVTTYRGHANIAGAVGYHDYRTGPVYERREDGTLLLRRGQRPAHDVFAAARARGALTQINHPTIFGGLGNTTGICRGCSWDYTGADTGYDELDAIEVANGASDSGTEPPQGSNPFTLSAIDFWDRALAGGARIAAVGGSDSHNAGRTSTPIDAPIGQPTTVVRAEELSEAGIVCGVRAGHSYVKVTGPAAPDLRFEATPAGGSGSATMGDVVRAGSAAFTARVLGGDGATLLVVRDGETIATVPVTGADFAHRFTAGEPGSYRLTLMRGSTVEALASPIYLRPGSGTFESRDCRPVGVAGSVRARLHARRAGVPVRCDASGAGVEACAVVAKARVRLRRGGPLRLRTIGRASAPTAGAARLVRVPLTATARRAITAKGRRGLRVRFELTATGPLGSSATTVRYARLVPPRAGRE